MRRCGGQWISSFWEKKKKYWETLCRAGAQHGRHPQGLGFLSLFLLTALLLPCTQARLPVTQQPCLLPSSAQHAPCLSSFSLLFLPLASPLTVQHQLHSLSKPNHFSTPLAPMSFPKLSSFLAWTTEWLPTWSPWLRSWLLIFCPYRDSDPLNTFLVMCVLCPDFGTYSQGLVLSFPSLQLSDLIFDTIPPDSWSLLHISCHKVLEHPSPRIGRALLRKPWRFPPSFGCLFRCHITRQTSLFTL